MSVLRLDLETYSLLSVKERAMYIIRDHFSDWAQALSDNAKIKEMKANAKRNARSKSSTNSSRS